MRPAIHPAAARAREIVAPVCRPDTKPRTATRQPESRTMNEHRFQFLRRSLVALAGLLLFSGCANQGFQWTGTAELSPGAMQRLVLRTTYPEPAAQKIPAATKSAYESAFLDSTFPAVRVIAKNRSLKPNADAYYLDAEVTRYKPGSPVGRFLMTPVIAFGLWGSYVDVSFALVDPANREILGKGMVRKANLWGGAVGRSITAETQLVACPGEILGDLRSFVEKP